MPNGRISTSTPSISGGHGDDQRTDVSPDVEQDGALPGVRVLGRRGAHDAFVVPGSVW